jgi:mannose-1-phosphate guanylyltransferase
MQAIILAGGKGTRLQEKFPDRPKALVPILDKPFIAWQLNWLASAGIHAVHVAAGHMASPIKDWVAANTPKGMTITLSEETEALGTAGGLKNIEKYIQTNPFVVVNGDTLMPMMDWYQFMEAHRLSNAAVTMAVSPVAQAGRYGTVEFDDSRMMTAFLEKQERQAGWVNGGLYIMNQETMRHITPDKMLSLEKDIFPVLSWLRTLQVYLADPPLLDMGTPQGIQEMESFLSTHSR